MDRFYEYLIKKEETNSDKVFKALVISVAVVLCMILLFLSLVLRPLSSIIVFLLAGVAYFAYYLAGTRNVEFEYCVTAGDVDVDKIMNRRKRVRIASVTSKSLVIMAPMGDSRLPSLEGRTVIDATSGRENVKKYVAVYADKGPKALIFEPTENMVEQIQKRNPRTAFKD